MGSCLGGPASLCLVGSCQMVGSSPGGELSCVGSES